jgi:hypothetical protein
VLTTLLNRNVQAHITAAVAEIAQNRAAIEQAKGMLILLYGVDEESAFTLLRKLSENENIKLRALAEQLVADCGALGGDRELPCRSVYDKLLQTLHDRVSATASD